MSIIENFVFTPAVQAALHAGQPVVALESTVITHGLPYPENVETARSMENAVRAGGATPATIAILSGIVHIGLSADQLEQLGRLPGTAVRKCSRRDLPLAVAGSETGATTVAGTMIVAHLAGIDLFATGGIGGVHRGHPFDISADLTELSRTPMTVVCSGAKAILDLPATREVLETNGVPIIGYGIDTLPAFYARSSGLPIDIRLDTPAAVAKVIVARKALDLHTATLVAAPVPEADACDPEMIEAAIAQATAEADKVGIHGPAATPWLLGRVVELTNGRSLHANKALLQNNGSIAGQIAVALSNALS